MSQFCSFISLISLCINADLHPLLAQMIGLNGMQNMIVSIELQFFLYTNLYFLSRVS